MNNSSRSKSVRRNQRPVPNRFEDFYAEAVRAMCERDPQLDRLMKIPSVREAVNDAISTRDPLE
ncbi:MAG: hypothetical protein RI897_4628 [Verrucomicrobiota bacterium]|jgi:hypothetical protein